jgi:hypothetical protein
VPEKSARVVTKISAVTAQKTDESADHDTQVTFNFGVNMDQSEQRSDYVKLTFNMSMDTEPSVAKFTIEGSATVYGDAADIEKVLSADPQTNVPIVFTKIYQEAYAVIFLLAGQIDVPYPSPALLKKTQVRQAYQNQISE